MSCLEVLREEYRWQELPELAAHVKDTAEARLADTAELLKGDIAPAEIAQAGKD